MSAVTEAPSIPDSRLEAASVRARYVASFFLHRWRRLLFEEAGGEEIPPRERSLSLGLKMALDELALAAVATWADLPTIEDRRRVNDELYAARSLYAGRDWLERPDRYHVEPPTLVSPEIRRTQSLGTHFEHLRFESEYEPHEGEPGRERWLAFRENRTAHAWMLRHPGKPRPWLVCIHAFQMGPAPLTLRAFRHRWLHERLGLNLVFPVLPLHGPRCEGARHGDGLLGGDYLNTVHGVAQAVFEIRRLLGWIRSQGTQAIGVYGLSLGGYTTALLAAVEEGIDCAIAGVPATDFLALERAHTPPFARDLARRAGVDWEAAAQVLRMVSPLALPARIPKARRFIFAGLGDRLSPPEHVRRLWRHWERPQIHWYSGGHLSFAFEPGVGRFLRQALKTSGLMGVRPAPS